MNDSAWFSLIEAEAISCVGEEEHMLVLGNCNNKRERERARKLMACVDVDSKVKGKRRRVGRQLASLPVVCLQLQIRE